MASNDYVEVDVEYVRETPGAFLVRDAKGRELWLPKSGARKGDEGPFEVAEWLAFKEGLI